MSKRKQEKIMSNANLIWKPGKPEKVFSVPIVDVYKVKSVSPDGRQTGTYYRIKPKDGVIIVPSIETEKGKFFLMVRQWRHGNEAITTEFPSGIIEAGESLEKAAARELREETGYSAESLTCHATIYQNPALMYNTCSFFTAENPRLAGDAAPDDDEYLERVLVPEEKLLAEIGTGEFSHALTVAALFFHLRGKQAGSLAQ